MPISSIHLTPSRRKKNGITSMKPISDICPIVWIAAVFVTPSSVRNGFVNA